MVMRLACQMPLDRRRGNLGQVQVEQLQERDQEKEEEEQCPH